MGATPYAPELIPPIEYPWWKYGLVVWPPRKLTTRQKILVALYYVILFGCISSVALLLVTYL